MSSCEYLPRTGHRHHADPRPGRGGPRGRGPLTCLAVPGPAVDLLHTLRGEPSDVATGAAFPEATFADAQNCTGKGAGCGEARKCPLLAWFLPSLFSHSQTSQWLAISAHLSPSSAPRNSLLYPCPCLVPASFSRLADPTWVPSNTRTPFTQRTAQ